MDPISINNAQVLDINLINTTKSVIKITVIWTHLLLYIKQQHYLHREKQTVTNCCRSGQLLKQVDRKY